MPVIMYLHLNTYLQNTPYHTTQTCGHVRTAITPTTSPPTDRRTCHCARTHTQAYNTLPEASKRVDRRAHTLKHKKEQPTPDQDLPTTQVHAHTPNHACGDVLDARWWIAYYY